MSACKVKTNTSMTIVERISKYVQDSAMEIFTFNVLLIIINLFVVVMQGCKRPIDMWMFNSLMDEAARSRFSSLLQTFTLTMQEHNMTYFMYQGTLLGSYRHHGHIGWDDDIDFMLSLRDKEKVKEITHKMGVKYGYYDSGPMKVLKFFFKRGPEFPTNSEEKYVTWPHVDVTFYDENDTHIWDPKWAWLGYEYPKSEVFPLVNRPFDGLMLPAPCNPEKILMKTYDIHHCRTHMFNHRLFMVVPYFLTAEKRCSVLGDRFPFVERVQYGDTITERSKIGGWTIKEFNTTLPCSTSSSDND